MSVYFLYAYNLFADFEFYFEKTKSLALATVVGAIMNIILNFIFIKLFGYIAAGYTTLICYMLYTVLHYVFMRKICNNKLNGKQPYDTRILLGITIVFLLLGFTTLFTYGNSIVRYVFVSIIIIALAINYRKIKDIVFKIRKKQ